MRLNANFFALFLISLLYREGIFLLANAQNDSVCTTGSCLNDHLESANLPKRYYIDKEKKKIVDLSKTFYIANSGGVGDAFDFLDSIDDNCLDEHSSCRSWAADGECTNNPNYMEENCRLSCDLCFTKNEGGETFDFGVKYGVHQVCEGDRKLETIQIVKKMEKYMREEVSAKNITLCKNQESLCAFWALSGECDKNPFMNELCAPVCEKCHLITP